MLYFDLLICNIISHLGDRLKTLFLFKHSYECLNHYSLTPLSKETPVLLPSGSSFHFRKASQRRGRWKCENSNVRPTPIKGNYGFVGEFKFRHILQTKFCRKWISQSNNKAYFLSADPPLRWEVLIRMFDDYVLWRHWLKSLNYSQ